LTAGHFFLPLIIMACNLRFSYSYRQRRSRGFQSEEAENWIPRGAKEFSLCFILYSYVLINIPHTKTYRFTYKKRTAPEPKTCRGRMGEVQYMNDL
jgi:hypothetical protein